MSERVKISNADFSSAVDLAAEWWANCLRAKPVLDNGDRSNVFSVGLAEIHASQHELPSAEKIRIFKAELGAAIVEQFAAGKFEYEVTISVDYDPCAMLANALKAAAIESRTKGAGFPWKTYMTIGYGGTVRVAKGYGAPDKILRRGESEMCSRCSGSGRVLV